MAACPGHRSDGWQQCRRRLAIWAGGSALGAAVVALPDSGPRVVSLSETHGPSAVDLVGVAVLLMAWLPAAVPLWRGRSELAGPRGRHARQLALLGGAVLVVTIASDLNPWWLLGVALLVAAQLIAVATIAGAGRCTS